MNKTFESKTNIATTVSSGFCGPNVQYCLNTDGVLTISGTGAMTSWSWSLSAPWYSIRYEVKKVVIGNGVTSIGDCAFSFCRSLTSITIPDSVTSIGYEAFSDCTSLTGVAIPDSVTTISDHAFRNCESLTSVVIGHNVATIGDSAFYYCKSLTSIAIPNSVTSIGEFAFRNCNSLTNVYYSGTEEDWAHIKIEARNLPLEAATKHFSVSNKPASLEQIALYDAALEIAIQNGFEKTFESDSGADLQRENITLSVEKQEDDSLFIKGRKRPRYFGSRVNNETELKSFFKDLMG